MEVIERKPEAIRQQHTSTVEIVDPFSRGLARRYAENREARHVVPGKPIRKRMYVMYMKIGATAELPSRQEDIDSFLADFWNTIYFKNNLVPDDIPFDIIIEAFTDALVQGEEVDRKGNNQAAICQAFNGWIKRTSVRNRLYAERDRRYPNSKPKQLGEAVGFSDDLDEANANADINGKDITEWPDDVLVDQFNTIKQLYSSESGELLMEMIKPGTYRDKLVKEIERRGIEV